MAKSDFCIKVNRVFVVKLTFYTIMIMMANS